MPLTFRLTRDHFGPPYSSDARYIAISDQRVVGSVGRDVFTDQRSVFRWQIAFEQNDVGRGHCDTIGEAKAALEAAWWAWVQSIGLRDDETVEPLQPQRAAVV